MGRILSLAYGIVAYVLFLAVFLYAVAFVGDFGVPKTIDSGAGTSVGQALVIDLVLLLLFGLQHSVMARDWFKERWTKIVPWHIERSTYVLIASAVLAFVMWQWRPISGSVWSVSGAGATVLWAIFAIGWTVVLITTFLIDHFRLFGLSQVWAHFRGEAHRPPEFQEPGFYHYVRHPLYLGFVLAFWAIPEMSVGHVLFAVATTGYMLVAIQFEERDLVRYHGEQYEEYRERVPMLIPRPRKPAAEGPVDPERP